MSEHPPRVQRIDGDCLYSITFCLAAVRRRASLLVQHAHGGGKLRYGVKHIYTTGQNGQYPASPTKMWIFSFQNVFVETPGYLYDLCGNGWLKQKSCLQALSSKICSQPSPSSLLTVVPLSVDNSTTLFLFVGAFHVLCKLE